MSDDDIKFTNKKVDESWKNQIWDERVINPNASPEEALSAESRKITFGTFIDSLALQTLIALGEMEDPIARTKAKDLAQAQHLIDLLILLREKTKGNLNATEVKLLDAILADLQFRFVQNSRSA